MLPGSFGSTALSSCSCHSFCCARLTEAVSLALIPFSPKPRRTRRSGTFERAPVVLVDFEKVRQSREAPRNYCGHSRGRSVGCST